MSYDFLDYERLALTSLISHPEVRDLHEINPMDFGANETRLIAKSLAEMMSQGRAVDLMLLAEHMERSGDLSRIGGFTYLSSLASNVPAKDNAPSYIAIVKRQALARRCIAAGNKIAAALNSSADIDARIAEASAAFDDLTSLDSGSKTCVTLKEAMTGAVEYIEGQYENSGKEPEYPFGFTDLDEMTQGAGPGDLVVIAGRPSMGKTAMSMNVVETLATKGKVGLVVSIEMGASQLALRMIGSSGRINIQTMRKGNMQDDDFSRVTCALSKMSEMKLVIDETPGASPSSIRRAAKSVQKMHGKIDFIVIDYLQLMNGDKSRYDNRTAEIGEISRGLKLLAKEFGIPIFLLSQLNRSLEQRPNKRPIMSDLRESGAIEQDADIIIFLYRDEVYNPDSPEVGCAELIVAKQRNGPIGFVRVAFRGDISRFEDFSGGGYAG